MKQSTLTMSTRLYPGTHSSETLEFKDLFKDLSTHILKDTPAHCYASQVYMHPLFYTTMQQIPYFNKQWLYSVQTSCC